MWLCVTYLCIPFPQRVCCMCVLRPLSSPTTSAQKETNTTDTATIHKHTMPKRHADSTQDENPRKRRQLSADEVLMEAARNGDTTAVRAVLEKLSPDRTTVAFDAAHEACRGNHDECLTLLLPYVETTQVDFGILLSECVHADHVACTEVLLQHWKSVCNNVAFVLHDSKHSAGQSATVCPTMWSDPAVCRVLIDAGADLHTKDENGRLPLHYASDAGALDVVKMLVRAGAGVRATDDDGDTCLFRAANGHTETVRYLVGLFQVEVNHRNDEGFTALHSAVVHTDVVQVLIDAGADIDTKNKDGRSPLHFACLAGALEVVKMLVRAGAGVCVTDVAGCGCLAHTTYFGHTETVRYLLCLPEVDVNCRNAEHNFTALQDAVLWKHTDLVRVLIDAGADIHTQNEEGRSPLHESCASGALDVVKMLVEAGAGVHATDNEGCTCLILTAWQGHTETVRYLVGLPEVDVNHSASDVYDHTAFHIAALMKHTDVVQVLIDAGADIHT